MNFVTWQKYLKEIVKYVSLPDADASAPLANSYSDVAAVDDDEILNFSYGSVYPYLKKNIWYILYIFNLTRPHITDLK